MRAPLKKDFMHDCSSPEEGCQNLINAVFHQAYYDLVRSLRNGYRMALQAEHEDRTMVRWKMEDAAAVHMNEANRLKKWFKDVLPIWREINPQIIITRAYVESGADFSKLRDGDER